MAQLRLTTLTSLFLLTVFLLLPEQNVKAEKKDPKERVFELEAVLSGKDIHYEYYREFKEKYYSRGPEGAFEPIKDFKADSNGGEVKYYENIRGNNLCAVSFEWKFDRDISEVKAGEEAGVTLSYEIDRKECVDSMAQGWMAFTVNDPYYEQFLGNDLDEKVKDGLPAGSDIAQGPRGGALELDGKRGKMSTEFKIEFPESGEAGTYFTLRLTIFRYYFPNTPVAVYLFKAK